VKLGRKASQKQLLAALRGFRPLQRMTLPSAPDEPIQIRYEDDRPQPRLDVDRASGMGITVGRIRPCPVLDWKFDALGHNTIRGAAGAAILNAELLAHAAGSSLTAAATRDFVFVRHGETDWNREKRVQGSVTTFPRCGPAT